MRTISRWLSEFMEIPRWVRQQCPSRLELRFRTTAVCMMFGLPFFASGLVICYGLLVVAPINMFHSPPANWEWGPALLVCFLLLPICLVMTYMGALLVFQREGVIVDREANAITLWWRVLLWKRTETRAISRRRKAYCEIIEDHAQRSRVGRFGLTFSGYYGLFVMDADEYPLLVLTVGGIAGAKARGEELAEELEAFLRGQSLK